MRDLIFTFVDHFEPRAPAQWRAWLDGYPKAVEGFHDAGGRHPRHTWFYDRDEPAVLEALSTLCRRGLGEIEVHLHHGHDTAAGLREKLEARKACYARFGALVTAGPSPKAAFAFIHGKWSLDNSRGDAHCGVNDELRVLRDAGCYADFTFPAWGRMQPAKRSSIYYATDDAARPKSYNEGVDVEAGRAPSGDLMIFQGPGRRSGIPQKIARFPGLARLADRLCLTCAIDADLPPWPARVDRWVDANVHVKGRPEWVFVKVHTHGARPENAGAYLDRWSGLLHAHLARRYNDGRTWRLHYATAREAYNIVKAAEAGKSGDPETYRDFVIGRYGNTR